MENLQGKTIEATSLLDGSLFEKAIILITEHNAKGASGFVVNKHFSRKLNELEEFNHAAAIDIFEGGPVDKEHIYFLHNKADILQGTEVNPGIFFGGDFHKAVKLLSDGKLSAEDVKVFIGYCGWGTGELESEIEEGSWKINVGSLFENEPL
jgi:putative transcriptional regulator